MIMTNKKFRRVVTSEKRRNRTRSRRDICTQYISDLLSLRKKSKFDKTAGYGKVMCGKYTVIYHILFCLHALIIYNFKIFFKLSPHIKYFRNKRKLGPLQQETTLALALSLRISKITIQCKLNTDIAQKTEDKFSHQRRL